MAESGSSASPHKVQKLSTSVQEISSEADYSILDSETQKALEDVDSCQNEIDVLNEKASEEILQVEQKYNRLRKPHYEKRNGLIKQIPNFWVTVLVNHPQMSSIINEEEEECLHYLKQMTVDECEDIKSGYVISFHFAANPYFTDAVLKKELFLSSTSKILAGGRPASKSSIINWKPGMNLTKRAMAAMKNRKRRHGESSSFFSWFSSIMNPSMDKIAEVLKDDIWPNPLQYYLAPDIEVEENGITDDEDSDSPDEMDDSVVIVGDDDDDDEDDDDDVYEVDGDDDDDELLEETVDSIEVEDDDDDDAIELLESDSETGDVQEISQDSLDRTDNTANTTQDSPSEKSEDTSQVTQSEVESSVVSTSMKESSDNDPPDPDTSQVSGTDMSVDKTDESETPADDKTEDPEAHVDDKTDESETHADDKTDNLESRAGAEAKDPGGEDSIKEGT